MPGKKTVGVFEPKLDLLSKTTGCQGSDLFISPQAASAAKPGGNNVFLPFACISILRLMNTASEWQCNYI